MNPAPTAWLAFLRLNISALECERPHQRPQDSRPLQLSQRGIAFRNVGRKPRSEQKHQKDGVERAAPNPVSAGIFQTHLSSVGLTESDKNCAVFLYPGQSYPYTYPYTYILSEEECLQAGQQLQDSEEKEEDNTFSCFSSAVAGAHPGALPPEGTQAWLGSCQLIIRENAWDSREKTPIHFRGTTPQPLTAMFVQIRVQPPLASRGHLFVPAC